MSSRSPFVWTSCVVVAVVLVAAFTWVARIESRYDRALESARTAGLETDLASLASDEPNPAGERLRQCLEELEARVPQELSEVDWEIPEVPEALVACLPELAALLDRLTLAAAVEEGRLLGLADLLEPLGIPDRLPIQELLRSSDLLIARALVRAGRGELAGASSDLRAVRDLGSCIAREPGLLCGLLRLSLADAALRALGAILARVEDPVAFLDAVETDPCEDLLARGVRSELTLLLDQLERGNWEGRDMPWYANAPVVGALHARTEAAALLETWVAARPLLEDVVEDRGQALANLVGEIERKDGEWAWGAVHQWPDIARLVDQHLALRAAARAAAQIHGFRRRTGRWPTEIREVPAAAAVIDPLSGRPFEIARDPDDPEAGLLLVSIGPWPVRWLLEPWN